MGIFTRFRDIVASNINSILDRAEDPEKMVRLMIQEMEDTLVEVKASCAGFMADQKRIQKSLAETESEVAGWDARARLALEKGREDLARAALAEKRLFQSRTESLTRQVEQFADLVSNTQGEISQLESKLADAREKQRLIIQRRAAALNRVNAQGRIRQLDTSEAFVKFEAYESGIDRLEAEADLVDSLRPKDGSLRQKFSELENSETIEQELDELRKQVQAK